MNGIAADDRPGWRVRLDGWRTPDDGGAVLALSELERWSQLREAREREREAMYRDVDASAT